MQHFGCHVSELARQRGVGQSHHPFFNLYTMEIRVFTAFSGYDSQCIALERAGVSYDLVGWSEIDKYAIMAHNAIFPQFKDRNYGDITKIDWNIVPDFDLFTYSSPCQDFSRAGNMMGGAENSGTRSSLLWECRKAIMAKNPKYLILENVRDLVSKRFFPLFESWMHELEDMGYENHWKVINAADCNCPQNRQRVILVSIRRFSFQEPMELTETLDTKMEAEIDRKYYVPASEIGCIMENQHNVDVLRIRQATKAGYIDVVKGGLFDSSFPKSKTRRGRVQGDGGNLCPTLTATASDTIMKFEGYKDGTPIIRRLTEREIFRLMGVDDDRITRISDAGIGSRQQGKLAGNSICVDVLEGVFRQMFN